MQRTCTAARDARSPARALRRGHASPPTPPTPATALTPPPAPPPTTPPPPGARLYLSMRLASPDLPPQDWARVNIVNFGVTRTVTKGRAL